MLRMSNSNGFLVKKWFLILRYVTIVCVLVLVLIYIQNNSSSPSYFAKTLNGNYTFQTELTETLENQEKISHPWIEDDDCQHFIVQFAQNKSLPKWALTSFPGSGVTWTRQLVEGATGIYTGTVYGASEPPIVSTGYHGNEADLNCDCTVLIKDHDGTESNNLVNYLEMSKNHSIRENQEKKYENRGILLIRNPIDVLFTYAHYLNTMDQIGTVSPDTFKGSQWDDYVDYVAYAWADHAQRWIQTIQNGTVIFYEKLIVDTENELRRLLNAIHSKRDGHGWLVDPKRMLCTLSHRNRKDRKRDKKPMVPLKAAHRAKLKASVDEVQTELRKKGWPLLPLHLYKNLN